MEIHWTPQLGTELGTEYPVAIPSWQILHFCLPKTYKEILMVRKLRTASEAQELFTELKKIKNWWRSIERRNWVLNWVLSTQLHFRRTQFD